MMFSRGEVVFYRLKIRCKTANVAEMGEEKLRLLLRCLGSIPEEQSDLGRLWRRYLYSDGELLQNLMSGPACNS